MKRSFRYNRKRQWLILPSALILLSLGNISASEVSAQTMTEPQVVGEEASALVSEQVPAEVNHSGGNAGVSLEETPPQAETAPTSATETPVKEVSPAPEASQREQTPEEVSKKVTETVRQLPQLEGPIAVTADNYPFSAMEHNKEPIDLAAYGYTEEEYFFTGTANVYEGYPDLQIAHENLPYKNRIIVRKPSAEKFSGRVYIDILNASNQYDIEGLWYRSHRHLMENNHAYIGMTSKPVVVEALKSFNPERYGSLSWAGEHTLGMTETPLTKAFGSIPGTEEGLVWDMLSQLGYMVKTNQADFLEGYPVEYLYLTGQSQSAMYLNTYAYYFGEYLEDIYDGFLSTVGPGRMRTLSQNEQTGAPLPVRDQLIGDHTIHHIQVAAQGDVNLLQNTVEMMEALANDYEYMRLYEVASAPHSDPTSPIAPNNDDIIKAGKAPRKALDEFGFEVSTLQMSYYVDTALEMLHNWASKGIEPLPSVLLDRDAEGQVILDEHGNGVGGLRSPYVDVPVATYHANAISDPNQTKKSMDTNGSMVYFTEEKLNQMYDGKADYLAKFKAAVDKQVAEGWLLPSDAERMLQWSRDIADQLFTEPEQPAVPEPQVPGGEQINQGNFFNFKYVFESPYGRIVVEAKLPRLTSNQQISQPLMTLRLPRFIRRMNRNLMNMVRRSLLSPVFRALRWIFL